MNVMKNNKGFSLVELMVVVAIIGILASVAVPQFSKFQAKSRQSEAKSSLTTLYTAEKSFNAEYAGYATAFQALGYAPAGDVLYNVGFVTACANWGACAPQYEPGGVAPVVSTANASASAFCAAAGTADNGAAFTSSGCRMKSAGAAGGAIGPVALSVASTASTTTFTASAEAQIYSSYATTDKWTIDNNKVLRNTAIGIP